MMLWGEATGGGAELSRLCSAGARRGARWRRRRSGCASRDESVAAPFCSRRATQPVETGVRQRAEQGVVQELVAQAAVQVFDESVLRRLAPGNVMPSDPAIVGEREDRARGQLGAVVADDRCWLTRSATRRSSSRATRAPERDVSATRARHSRVKSSTTVDAQAPAAGELGGHDVEQPALVRPEQSRRAEL